MKRPAEGLFGVEKHRDSLKATEENWGDLPRKIFGNGGGKVAFEEMTRAVGNKCLGWSSCL